MTSVLLVIQLFGFVTLIMLSFQVIPNQKEILRNQELIKKNLGIVDDSDDDQTPEE